MSYQPPPELLERIRRLTVRMAAADLILETATTRDDFVDAFEEASLVTREVCEILRQLPDDVSPETIAALFGATAPQASQEKEEKPS